MSMTLILYFIFQEKDFEVISWVSIKYCEFSPFFKIKLSIFTFYGNQMNRISLSNEWIMDRFLCLCGRFLTWD